MDDNELEPFSPHKKGEILELKNLPKGESNQWKIIEYLIGGYELFNFYTGEYQKALYEDIEYASVDLKSLPGHRGHDVIVTYVSHPEHDKYVYCRDCKQEITTKFSKLPPPNQVYFYGK